MVNDCSQNRVIKSQAPGLIKLVRTLPTNSAYKLLMGISVRQVRRHPALKTMWLSNKLNIGSTGWTEEMLLDFSVTDNTILWKYKVQYFPESAQNSTNNFSRSNLHNSSLSIQAIFQLPQLTTLKKRDVEYQGFYVFLKFFMLKFSPQLFSKKSL